MGSDDVLLSTDSEAIQAWAGKLDFLLYTIPEGITSYLTLPCLQLSDVSGSLLVFGEKTLGGSAIGGLKQTQETIDYCATHRILSEIELVTPDQANMAFELLKKTT